MAIPKLKQLSNLDDSTKAKVKPILIGAIVLLMGAFGLTVSNTDLNLNKLMSGSSVQESMIKPTGATAKTTTAKTTPGTPVKKADIKRDAQGTFLPENCTQDVYNCSSFTYREDAQEYYDKCGGAQHDKSRLDGNNDGQACESLPSKSK